MEKVRRDAGLHSSFSSSILSGVSIRADVGGWCSLWGLSEYMGSASAYAAVLYAIQSDIEGLLKTHPDIFSFATTAAGFVEVRDFQTTGVVAFAKGLPFSKLQAGKQTINGHRVQVKQEYLTNSIHSMEVLVSLL